MRRRKKSDLIFALLVAAIILLCVYALLHKNKEETGPSQVVYSAEEKNRPRQRPVYLRTKHVDSETRQILPPIVELAQNQLGNEGGEPYWRWFGFDSRVDWCACFISWCANECGYLEEGFLPKFSTCDSTWFREKGLWREADYIPSAGDLIFFDWTQDGTLDHVGIVEAVTEQEVHTIEGNTGDLCARQVYDLQDPQISGYAAIAYPDCSQ